MAGERQLAVGRKNPHTIVRLRIGRWDDERRLREVCPVRDPLHGVVVETITVQHDGAIQVYKKDAKGVPLDGIPFHPYYTVKDMFGASVFL